MLEIMGEILSVEKDAFKERRRNSALRAIAGCMLIRFGGQTQRQAAKHRNMSTGGAVSAQVRRLPDMLAEDRKLSRTVRVIEKRLKDLKAAKSNSSGNRNK